MLTGLVRSPLWSTDDHLISKTVARIEREQLHVKGRGDAGRGAARRRPQCLGLVRALPVALGNFSAHRVERMRRRVGRRAIRLRLCQPEEARQARSSDRRPQPRVSVDKQCALSRRTQTGIGIDPEVSSTVQNWTHIGAVC
eukprot:4680106-Pleurochrysis_carterae.AAC.2